MKRIFRKATTMLEIVIVLLVIGVLVSVAIPHFVQSLERAHAAEGIQMLEALRTAAIAYEIENDTYLCACTAGLSDCAGGNFDEFDVSFNTRTEFPDFCALDDCNGTCNPDTPLAVVERENGLYTLTIGSEGGIICDDGGSSDNWCEKIGISET